jgi:hypothetical protein
VLFRLRSTGLLDEFPDLAAYVARGEGRGAYQRAFADQLAIAKAAWSGESIGPDKSNPRHNRGSTGHLFL